MRRNSARGLKSMWRRRGRWWAMERSFEAAVEAFTTETGQAAIRWTARDLNPSVFEQAAILFEEGRTVRQVKSLLGRSHGEAGRLRLRAAAEGLLDVGQRGEPQEAKPAGTGHSG
jgi:hypothetical protein